MNNFNGRYPEYDLNYYNYKCGCTEILNGFMLHIKGKICKKHLDLADKELYGKL